MCILVKWTLLNFKFALIIKISCICSCFRFWSNVSVGIFPGFFCFCFCLFFFNIYIHSKCINRHVNCSSYLKIEICLKLSQTYSTFNWPYCFVTGVLLTLKKKCRPLYAHPVLLFLEISQLISESGVRSVVGTGW